MPLQSLTDSSITEALRSKRFRPTPQRISICRFVLGSSDHPTAQRIFKEVKKMHPTVSLATVYNTLRILTELQLVRELAFPNGESHFDSLVEPHLNAICVTCGEIIDINDSSIRELVLRTAAKAKYIALDQRLDIYGICEKCKGGGNLIIST